MHELVYVGSVRIPFLYHGVLLYYLSPKVKSRFIYILCIQLHLKCRKYLQQTKLKKSFITALRNRIRLDISHELSPYHVFNHIFHKIRKDFAKTVVCLHRERRISGQKRAIHSTAKFYILCILSVNRIHTCQIYQISSAYCAV